MTVIIIKKEDLKNFNKDVEIYINEKDIESNIILDAQKLTEIPKIDGWDAKAFKKIPLVLF